MDIYEDEAEIDVERLVAADPEGLYQFMLDDYPYMMSPDMIAEFTGLTGSSIRKILAAGEMQGCQIGNRWRVPKLSFLNYLYKNRLIEESGGYGEPQVRQTL